MIKKKKKKILFQRSISLSSELYPRRYSLKHIPYALSKLFLSYFIHFHSHIYKTYILSLFHIISPQFTSLFIIFTTILPVLINTFYIDFSISILSVISYLFYTYLYLPFLYIYSSFYPFTYS